MICRNLNLGAIGKPPLRIAAGSEKIWVLSEPEGTLTRIDAESDEVTGAPIDLGKGVAAVAVGGGSVWVTDARTGELLRVDDESGAVTQRIDVGGFVGSHAEQRRIDPFDAIDEPAPLTDAATCLVSRRVERLRVPTRCRNFADAVDAVH